VVCSSCGTEAIPGSKFRARCGARVTRACPACDSRLTQPTPSAVNVGHRLLLLAVGPSRQGKAPASRGT